MTTIKLWNKRFNDLTRIKPQQDWIEIGLISLLCETFIRMERKDLEYYIVQDNQYRIVFKYGGTIYNGHIDLDDIA